MAQKNSKMSWSENWICFILAISNIGLQHRNGKWNYLLSRKQIKNVLPLPAWYCWINFWIVTSSNTKTLNNFFLDLNIPTNNKIISYHTWDWTSLRMNIQIFLWINTCYSPLETQSTSFDSAFLDILDGNSNSNHWKTKHFLFRNAETPI